MRNRGGLWPACFIRSLASILVENSDALVAYLYGESRGTIYTIKEAAKKDIPIVMFVCDPVSSLLYQDLGQQIGGQIKIFEIGAQTTSAKLSI